MVPDTKEYCQSCVTCATAKTTTQSKLGLLTPLKRPAVPWERISIDFVGPLPESENLLGKWDMMLVAVDYATSMVRIIPTRQTFRAKEVAELMYENIYKIHGIPKVIVSDRDSLFTSTFWSESNRLMGVQTRMSSAYHPETDGATERANKTIGSMLRQCIKGRQSDWVRYLAGIEYAMNSSVSETTGYSPFYLNYGRVPPPMVWETENEYAGVRMFLLRQREL
ncbi:Transposon Ty3-I Gag-Pol polyprotein [Ceratobasidium sp. AG-Ba]|nr:Transposon Ty3-I Gag-Pol polyprotein [Ceratobasidium sp. AG-Ba]